jgi:hypothetical protein
MQHSRTAAAIQDHDACRFVTTADPAAICGCCCRSPSTRPAGPAHRLTAPSPTSRSCVGSASSWGTAASRVSAGTTDQGSPRCRGSVRRCACICQKFSPCCVTTPHADQSFRFGSSPAAFLKGLIRVVCFRHGASVGTSERLVTQCARLAHSYVTSQSDYDTTVTSV